ncbi:MAG: hypothetical protein M1820_003641 [Bogoriella megaspora]|nr:MAG: hypothetical protein M1820_003641 [Bogoriella megaspora]
MHQNPTSVHDQTIDATRVEYDEVLVRIVDYVFNYNIISEKAFQRARLALLDAFGCAVAAAASNEDCARLIGPVVENTHVPNGARVLGTAFALDPVKAAFDNGLLIRYLDHNDGFPGSEWGHPSDNLGAIVSVMDWLSRRQSAHVAGTGPSTTSVGQLQEVQATESPGTPRCTLHSLLVAQIKAYEVQGCFQISNAFNKVGLDHTILVKLASTAVVSWLIGLNYTQTLAAVSQVWQDGHPLRTFRQAPNTGPRKGWAAGDACMRAVHLALVTRAGQPGAPTVLTAPKWGFYATLFQNKEFVLPRPYGTWVMENIFFKTVAAEGHGITAVFAALRLCEVFRDLQVRPERDIACINIRTHAAAKIIIDKSGPLRNPADRDHCMQYLVAVTLLKGSVVEAEDYEDTSPWASDPRVDDLRLKMDIVEDETFTQDYHDVEKRHVTSALAVTLKDGRILDEVTVPVAAGHPLSSDTEKEVRIKFVKNMGTMFRSSQAEAAFKAVEDGELPVHRFVDLFTSESGANL